MSIITLEYLYPRTTLYNITQKSITFMKWDKDQNPDLNWAEETLVNIIQFASFDLQKSIFIFQ